MSEALKLNPLEQNLLDWANSSGYAIDEIKSDVIREACEELLLFNGLNLDYTNIIDLRDSITKKQSATEQARVASQQLQKGTLLANTSINTAVKHGGKLIGAKIAPKQVEASSNSPAIMQKEVAQTVYCILFSFIKINQPYLSSVVDRKYEASDKIADKFAIETYYISYYLGKYDKKRKDKNIYAKEFDANEVARAIWFYCLSLYQVYLQLSDPKTTLTPQNFTEKSWANVTPMAISKYALSNISNINYSDYLFLDYQLSSNPDYQIHCLYFPDKQSNKKLCLQNINCRLGHDEGNRDAQSMLYKNKFLFISNMNAVKIAHRTEQKEREIAILNAKTRQVIDLYAGRWSHSIKATRVVESLVEIFNIPRDHQTSKGVSLYLRQQLSLSQAYRNANYSQANGYSEQVHNLSQSNWDELWHILEMDKYYQLDLNDNDDWITRRLEANRARQ
ncbi:MAG: hypothetical protein JW841_08180 [Deltaproteobacteria bacterium]|nr:hypothetical protein [Deltaproteobacteria bacterium]